MAQAFGLVQSKGFEPAPAGRQPAILAEIAWEMVEDRFEGRGEQLKMFWCFQLQAEDPNGERYILDLELYPTISAKNAVGKFCRSWSASPTELTDDQINQWRIAVMGSLIERDAVGNPVIDDKGSVVTKLFETFEGFHDNVDPDPPLVGLTAIINVEHKEAASGRTYARITGIFPNGKVDAVGNIIKGADGKPEPAFEMEIENYVSRAERQAEIAKRIAEKEAKKPGRQQATPGQTAAPKAKVSVPFF